MGIKKLIPEKGLLQGDWVVWMILILLCSISVVEVYSASSNMSYKSGHYWEPVLKHGSYLLAGFVLTWIVHRISCNKFKLAGFLGHGGISFPLLVVALFSAKVNGASRWIEIGGITIQPSEIAKLTLVTIVTFFLAEFRDEKGASSTAFRIVFTIVFITLALIVSENASTAGIIFLVMFCICIYAQVHTKVLAWIAGLVLGGIILVGSIAFSIPQSTLDNWKTSKGPLHRVPTWVNRITNEHHLPENPKEYDLTENVQVTHAQIAIATSNIVGKGPGNSVQRDFLPQAFSDFIYAIIIEEAGIVGGAGVMFLYLLLMWRAMRIASRCKSLFPSYLVMGLALMMVVQAMVNMAVAVGAFPVTGQPLPLISKGGTSTFVNCVYIGMILSVSRSAKKKDEGKEELPEALATQG